LVFALVASFSAHPAAPAPLAAQQDLPVGAGDYGKWESLGASLLSPDGKWLAAQVRRVDGTYELRLHAVAATASGQESAAKTILESGGSPAFSSDSRWLAYSIAYSEADREAMQKADEPIHNKMGLIDLSSARLDPEIFEGVESFEISDDATFLAMRRYAPEESEVESADLVVRALNDGADINFGNVAEFAWREEGSLLAMTIAAAGNAGNGIHLYDPESGALRVLASGDAEFGQLAWRQDAADLAAFRSVEDDSFQESTHQVLVWRDLAATVVGAAGSGATVEALVFDPATRADFPAGMRVVDSRAPAWSDDGAKLFFGIREWEASPVSDEVTEVEPGAGADEGEETGTEPGRQLGTEPEQPEVEPADVDVWHTRDERLIPMQRLQKQRDLARNYLSVWHIDADRFVQLGSDLMETATVLEDDRHAIETDRKPYSFDNMFDRTRNDVYLIDVSTGERERVIEGTWYYRGGSATGRYLTYFAGEHYWVYDIATGRRSNITADVPTSFVDMEYDTPVREQRPPYGVAGWSQSDEALLLYDRYDIWGVHPDGSAAVNFTRGADEEIRHRYVRLDPDEEFIDLGKPVFMSLYGQWSKRYGYARMDHGEAPERLVFIDKNVGRLAKAEDAEIYSYIVQGFDDSPDIFVGGPDLAAHQVGATNPFQSDYAWGRSELIDYENSRGQRLQGALFYPAEYEPGKKYPLIVYVYEQLSQTVHSYTNPSERSPYNTSVFNAHGYFVLRPDIVYVDREPGISAADCVEAAVEAALDTGMIDPERVGLVGHSWGGYEATFIPTQTDIFATSIAGAAITNFFSFYGALHWNIGMAETQHFETGQARMDVPYWEDMEAYARNSSVIHIMDLNTPMLLFHGDNDGTVDFRQGVELYNYARRAGKFLVMLVYADEGHSARQKKNQVDYHHRILDWFGHFLKGEPAPAWISEGVSVIDRDEELERLKKH
jgi:dipeptidyl aminopeptidase/acylaminoacyl peptidase